MAAERLPSAPKVSIRCFGGVAIERDGVPLAGRATQRRRLALVVLLAASPDHPVSRDRLVALLWPESDTDSARHLLSGAVYELRKVFGEDAILSSGDDLWLDPKVVQSDVTKFEAAMTAGAPATAVQLYRGAFADGFHVGDAPDFERWLEEARDRYRRMFRQALEAIASARTDAGDARGAADAWLRLAAEDPSDARVLMHAMRALDAAGNRAGALRQAAVYEAFMRAEFGAEPAGEVRALVDSLRRSDDSTMTAQTTLPGSGAPSPGPLAPAPRARSSAPALWIGAAAAVVVMMAAVSRFVSRAAATDDSADGATTTVVVRPFSVQGGMTSAQLGAFPAALSAALEGLGSMPGLYVNGNVHEAGGRLRVHATLHEGDGRRVGEASAEGVSDRPFELVDVLAIDLAAARWSRPKDRTMRAVARSTRSLPALKAYLAGENDRRAGRFAAAAEWFARAVTADSAFALAHYRLSQATLAADLPMAQADAADERAARHSVRLSEPEHLLLNAYAAFRRGDAEIAEQIYRGLIATYPDDVEAWRQLGETLFHYNPLRGRAIGEARVAFERVLTEEAKDWDALWHLAQIAASDGRRDDALRAFDALLTLRPGAAQSLELRALRALASRDRAAETALAPELMRADELQLHQIVWRSAVYLGDIAGAERMARFMAADGRPRYSRNVGHQDLAYLYLARGQWRAAARELAEAGSTFPPFRHDALMLRAMFAVQTLPARPRGELQSLRDSLTRVTGTRAERVPQRLLVLGLLEVAIGDTTAALARGAQLQRLEQRPLAAAIRGAVARARGDASSAVREIEQSFGPIWIGLALTSAEHSRSVERFMYAEALREAGRFREALGWYASFGEHAPHDLRFLAPAHLRRAELYQQMGEWKRASSHYARVVELWRDSDSELHGLREQARARADSLSRLGRDRNP